VVLRVEGMDVRAGRRTGAAGVRDRCAEPVEITR
jgi:hypothetical protein